MSIAPADATATVMPVGPDALPSSTDAIPYPRPALAYWTMAVLLLLNIGSCLDRQILALMVDAVKADLGISDFQVSLLQGMTFALFYATFGLPLGWAADRFSRSRLIFAGVTVWSIAASACGLAQNFWQLMVARIGVGVGEASLSPAAFSLLSDTFPRHRLAFAISVFSTGAVIGSALALAIGGLLVGLLPAEGITAPLLGHLRNWQVVYIVTGLPCLAIGWLIFTVADPVRRGRVSSTTVPVRETLRFVRRKWRFFVPHFGGFGLMSLCGYGVLIWTPSYIHRVFGWEMIVIGPICALVMLTGVFGGTALGVIADRWFAKGRTDAHLRLYMIVAIVQPVLIVAAIAVDNPYGFFILYGCYHVISSFTGVSSAALQIVTPNEYRGQVSAAFLMTFNLLGLGVGPSVVAALTSFVFRDPAMVGWAIAATYAIVMPIAALCFASGLAPMRRAVAEAVD
jgi:MFS family permease